MQNLSRVLLIDSASIVRAGMASILMRLAPQAQVEEVECPGELLDAGMRGPWNLIVIDPVLDGTDGIELVRTLRRDHRDTPILVFTGSSERHLGVAALVAGANGFISKRAKLTEIEEALGRVSEGHEHASPELKERVGASRSPFGKGKAGFAALSEAERLVLRELGRGQTAKEIALTNGVGASTIGTYRARILEKLGLRTTAELVRFAVEHKLH